MRRLLRPALFVLLLLMLVLVPSTRAYVGDRLAADRVPVISRVLTKRPYVAITVDDFYTGDYRRETAVRMLGVANAAHAALTLCPAGSGLTSYTKIAPLQAREIRGLVAAGHYELCDHTFSHPILPKVGTAQAQAKEIVAGAAAIKQFFGRPPSRLFRPPYGSWNAQTQAAAAQAGFQAIITWSVDSGDSEGPEKPAAQLVADIACARPGDIILMHANRRSSAEALPQIIKLLRQRGLEPVTVSTLLASGTPVYSTNPADMRRLYTCVHEPVAAAPVGAPVQPAAPPAAPAAPLPPHNAVSNRDPDRHNNPEASR